MTVPPAVVRVHGDQDIATVGDLRAALQAAAASPDVVIDLRGVRYMDSLAINELFRTVTGSERRGGRVAIVARNQDLVRLLSIAGLTPKAKVVDSLNAALSYLESQKNRPS